MNTSRLEVETKIPGGLLGAPERLVLEFPLEETLTVQELIRLKVEEEIRRLVAMETLDRRPGREYRDIGTAETRASELAELETEVRKAQQAFASGRFLILVNGRRYTRLDERITLAPQTTAKFIRLMPLTGG
ncbi:MAG: hypothetical protein JW850_00855 [Thermoflexales bacterium]|nr:hypothetical protein [Thermoflexales bacterium]